MKTIEDTLPRGSEGIHVTSEYMTEEPNEDSVTDIVHTDLVASVR